MRAIKVKVLDTDSKQVSLVISLRNSDDSSTEEGILMHLSMDLTSGDEADVGRIIDELISDEDSELERLARAGLEWFKENHIS